MSNKSELLLSLLDGQPVIPVLKIERAEDAVPLAQALAKGGLRMIEITLRTRRRSRRSAAPPARSRKRLLAQARSCRPRSSKRQQRPVHASS